uniref:Uracil-DNA glycosylase n=1 Tax=Labrus bergylta TaxID=56723 RepID=A0A3Q3E216_9LABR
MNVNEVAFTSTALFLIVAKSVAHLYHNTSMFALHCRRFVKHVSPPARCLSSALYFSKYTKIVQKKPKCSAGDPEPSSPRPAPLSPEQLDRIARNKKAALEKLSSAQTPPGFGESWREGLSAEFGKSYFKQLMSFVSEERKRHNVYPPAEHVFTWTQMCDIKDVKVVILGQDPYHGPKQAHGLCFSVKQPVPPPPSLENMYKELVSDIEGFQHPGHGDLTEWAKQGVLLLNAVLTVRAHQANSHKDKGWESSQTLWCSGSATTGKASSSCCGERMLRRKEPLLTGNGTTSCRRCILLPCLHIEDFLAASISRRRTSCYRNLERLLWTGRHFKLSFI